MDLTQLRNQRGRMDRHTDAKEFIVVKEFMVRARRAPLVKKSLSGSTGKSTPDGDDQFSQEPERYRDTSRPKY